MDEINFYMMDDQMGVQYININQSNIKIEKTTIYKKIYVYYIY